MRPRLGISPTRSTDPVDQLPSWPNDGALRTFVEAVVQHLAFAGDADDSACASIRGRVTALVGLAVDAETAEDAARALAGDAPVLASFFQNVDLLYEGAGYAHADALAAAVMRAVEMLEAAAS